MSKDNIQKKKGIPAGILIFIGVIFLPVILLLLFVTLKLIIEGKDVIAFTVFLIIELGLGYLISFNPIRKGIKKLSKKPVKTTSKIIDESQLQTNKNNTNIVNSKNNSYNEDTEKQWTKYTTQDNKYLDYKDFKDNKIKERVENLNVNNNITVCRDNQFDDGNKSVIGFLLKTFVLAWLPIIMGIFIYYLLAKSVEFKILPGTWQAYVSLLIVVVASTGAIMTIKLYSKRNNVGNKFLYYVISDEGLYFTHLAFDEIGRFIRAHTKSIAKLASVPMWMYVLAFMLNGSSRYHAIRLARAETSFRINKKYQIAERLLKSDEYKLCCNKVLAVTKLKEYSYGCEVTWKYLRNGVEGIETHIIYKNTNNYEQLINEFKKRIALENVGDILNKAEKRQLYANVVRISLTLLLGAFVIIVVAIDSYGLYLRNIGEAENLSDGMLKSFRYFLAYRGRRRSIRGIYGILLLVIIPIVKMVVDIINIKKFTVTSVKVIDYYKPKRKIYYEVLSEFHYFATVKWSTGTVTVGLSKDMWKQRESVEPLLVLRKGVPYCLIYRKNLSER